MRKPTAEFRGLQQTLRDGAYRSKEINGGQKELEARFREELVNGMTRDATRAGVGLASALAVVLFVEGPHAGYLEELMYRADGMTSREISEAHTRESIGTRIMHAPGHVIGATAWKIYQTNKKVFDRLF